MKLDVKTMYDWPLSMRLLVIAIIAVIVLIVGYWWDLSTLREKISDGQKQEDELKLQLESSISKEKKLSNDLSQYTQLETSLANWKKKIIKHSQLPSLLNDILKLGAANHLYFALFNPEQETVDGAYRRVPIKVIVLGSYHQIGDFFSQVANMPWLVVIRDFVISNEAKEEVVGEKLVEQAKAQNLLTGEVTLEVYHYPDPTELVIIKPDKATDAKPGAGATPAATPSPTPAPAPASPTTTPSETANAPTV